MIDIELVIMLAKPLSVRLKKRKRKYESFILLVDGDVKSFLVSRVCSSCHFPGVHRDHFNRPFGHILLPEQRNVPLFQDGTSPENQGRWI